MGLESKVQEFVLNIAIKKGIKSLTKLMISFLTSAALVHFMASLGITFEVDQNALTGGLTLLVNSGLEIARNYVKIKFGAKV